MMNNDQVLIGFRNFKDGFRRLPFIFTNTDGLLFYLAHKFIWAGRGYIDRVWKCAPPTRMTVIEAQMKVHSMGKGAQNESVSED